MADSLRADAITLDHERYAERRAEVRAAAIALRRERKVRVGNMLSFSFENAATLAYQIQEMAFTERLSDPLELAHEVGLHERMLPDSHSLVATMLVELTDPTTIKGELARLEGLQRSVSLELGPEPGSDSAGLRVRAEEIPAPDEDPDQPGPLVSVHVLRFRFTDAARDAFRNPAVPAELVVDHPEYADGTPLTDATRKSLIADLALGN